MKLTYIITGMFNSAGMERVVANKANYFATHGHDVSIITTDQNGRPYFYNINPLVKHIDLAINYFEYNTKSIIFKPFLFFYKTHLFKQRLTAELFKERPDVVISLSLKSVDFLYKIHDGSTKIVEHHFSKFYAQQFSDTFNRKKFSRFIYNLRGKIESYYLKKYDHFVVLTQEDANLWGTKFKNLTVIPNSLSFIPTTTSSCKKEIVVAIGRLDYQKGFDQLIQIWNTAYLPGWELHIYGNGQERAFLQKLIEQSPTHKSIKLFAATNQVETVLNNSSIYALTSRFEGFPMILLEAMSYGLPVVAMDCKCGPREIITHYSDGFLIEEQALEAFAEKLRLLMQNESLRQRMGAKASHNILRFSEDTIMDEWNTLFTHSTKSNH